MPLFDFRCSSGHTSERIVPSSQRETQCTSCAATAHRQVASRVAIVGPTTDTRGLYRRFSEASAEMGHAAEKREQGGETVAAPNLWKASKQRADAMIAAGENPITKRT